MRKVTLAILAATMAMPVIPAAPAQAQSSYHGRTWRDSHGRLRCRLVCHCLLAESEAGLVLIDTGYGLRDVDHPHRNPNARITRTMRAMLNIKLREEETAIRQIERLGFNPADVRHIVLTHLDF